MSSYFLSISLEKIKKSKRTQCRPGCWQRLGLPLAERSAHLQNAQETLAQGRFSLGVRASGSCQLLLKKQLVLMGPAGGGDMVLGSLDAATTVRGCTLKRMLAETRQSAPFPAGPHALERGGSREATNQRKSIVQAQRKNTK